MQRTVYIPTVGIINISLFSKSVAKEKNGHRTLYINLFPSRNEVLLTEKHSFYSGRYFLLSLESPSAGPHMQRFRKTKAVRNSPWDTVFFAGL